MENTFEARLKAVDQTTLTPLVRRALGSETVEAVDWDYQPVHGGFGDIGIGLSGVFRFVGSGRDQGEEVSWSFIVKVITSPVHSLDPQGGTRERLAYQSELLANLPGSLTAPRCFGITEQPAETFWLWLEEITDEVGSYWPLERYGLAARHLGQFNGAYLNREPLLTWPWLSKGWLRAWVAQGASGIAQLPTVLGYPLVRRIYPAEIVDGYTRLWAERGMFLEALDRLPQTLCHMDAFRRNLFARQDGAGREETVAVDWAFIGTGAVGEEIAPLVTASFAFFEIELAKAQELDHIVFEGYLDGLRDAGWCGDPRQVRFGYTAASILRYGVGVVSLILDIILDESQHPYLEQTFGRSTEEMVDCWAGEQRFLLSLYDEAQRLMTSLF